MSLDNTFEDTLEDSLDNTSEDTIVTLVSSDNIDFKINRSYVVLSKLLRVLTDNDKESTRIDLSVQSKTLEKIVEYLNYHKGKEPRSITRPLINSDLSKVVCEWDNKFIESISSDSDKNFILEVIVGANYMDIPNLLELGCAKVAVIIKK